MIGLAHQLSMGIVAEGVECEEQRSLLTELGCTHLQGYFFGKPASLQQVAQLVARKGAPAVAGALRRNPPHGGHAFTSGMRSAGSTTG